MRSFLTISVLLALAIEGGAEDVLLERQNTIFSGGPSASISLEGKTPVESGMSYLKNHRESKSSYVTRNGRQGWNEQRWMYFNLTASRFKNGALPLIEITVDYFDEGAGVVRLNYDSSDRYSGCSGTVDGTWKLKRAFALQNTFTWKSASFVIDDAMFASRCNGGDFRFESRCGLTLASLRITAANSAVQAENLKRLAERDAVLSRTNAFSLSYDDVLAKLKPYDGPSKAGTDPSSLYGKVMCGYQGWQCAPGDGSAMGWFHYFEDESFRDCKIDYWPDTSEFDSDEKYKTPFRREDGSAAYVFSPMNRKTVMRHFQWMEEAGIDGVFFQRFTSSAKSAKPLNKSNTVLMNIRAAANEHGRTYAVMYDLSGASPQDVGLLVSDWKSLVGRMGVGKDPNDKAYQRHKGKPVVALWGLAPDKVDVFDRLVDFMKDDPVYGGFSIKIGTCADDWRHDDTPNGRRVREIIKKADIVSPWTVARYGCIETAELYIEHFNRLDQKWCDANGKDYMPVVFPGFSWHNLRDGTAASGAIPRLQGRFLWRQFIKAKEAGAKMFYIAMFDEIDEGTAIYKCDPNPPACPGTDIKFLDYEGLPSDHYMWLAGRAGEMLSGKLPSTDLPPPRDGVAIDYKPLAHAACEAPPGLKEISIPSRNPQCAGGMALLGREGRIVPASKDGRQGWMCLPADRSDAERLIYLNVEYRGFRGDDARDSVLSLEYFDEGDATVKIVYDSMTGPWKQAGSFKLEDSKKWRKADIEIKAPLFIGRCNGSDIRLEIRPGQDFVLGFVKLRKSE